MIHILKNTTLTVFMDGILVRAKEETVFKFACFSPVV